MIKKILLAVSFCTTPLFADLSVDFSSDKDFEIRGTNVFQKKRMTARVWNWNPKDKTHKPMKDVKLSFEKGALKIDSSACKPDQKGTYGIFVVEIHPGATDPAKVSSYANKEMNASTEMKVDRPILGILFPAYFLKNKTMAYARGGNVPVTPEWRKLEKNFMMQRDISGEPIWRFTFEIPCVLWIRKASITFQKSKPKNEIVGNQILNGGAERGYYAVSGSNFKNLPGGFYRDWLGAIWTNELIASVDEREAASGRRSFRLDGGGKQYQNWFRFNPVKFTIGGRSVITFKAKSKEKHADLLLFCAVNTASGYRKMFSIGPEWKKYRFEIPSFGSPVGKTSGEYRAKGDDQFYPTFWANKTVWIDDVCYWQGAEEIEFENKELIAVEGSLNRPYCTLGESIVASMNFRNLSGKDLPMEITYELKDFFGKTIEKGSLGSERLGKNQLLRKKYSFPVKTRGPQTLTIQAKAGTEKIVHGFLFGGIGPEKGLVRRLVLDTTPATADFLIPFFRDMRIGSSRFWLKLRGKTTGGFECLKEMHDAGIQIMANISLDGDARYHSFSRHDLSSWRNSIRRDVMPYKDSIDIYEILNEPNIWNGFMKNPNPSIYKEMSPEEYVRVVAEAKKIIAEFAPKAKFAGPTTCSTDVGFIASVLSAGGAKYLDIITEHPYAKSPEMPDYYAKAQSLHKILKQHNKTEHWATEAGWISEEMLNENRITNYVRNSVSLNIRNMLTSFASGAKAYTIFAISPWGGASSWQLTMTGATGKIYEYSPQPVLYAMRTIADLLGDDAKNIGDVYLGFGNKCYLFDNGKTRTAVFWKWNGAPETIPCKPEYQGTFFDVMGNKINGSFELSGLPIYFQTTLPAKDVRNICADLVADRKNIQFASELRVTGKNTFDVLIANNGLQPLNGEIDLSLNGQGKQHFEIGEILPGRKSAIPFRSPKAISVQGDTAEFSLKLNEKLFNEKHSLRAIFAPYAPDLSIDADPVDWNKIPGTILEWPKNAYVSDGVVWSPAEKKIKAEMKLAWNKNGLFLLVIVDKETLEQEDRSSARLWHGDSIQLAFDPMRNAVKNQRKFDGDDFEYSVGMFRNKPTVYRHCASLSLYDSLQKSVGELKGNEVRCAILHRPGKMIYEIQFVPRAVSPFKLEDGASMRFNLIVNLNNGKERIGWLELLPGIGQYKAPGDYLDLLLLPSAK